MTKTLVELAKAVQVKKIRNTNFSKEDKDLFIAWANGEVTLQQVTVAKKFKSPNAVYSYLAMVARVIIVGNQ